MQKPLVSALLLWMSCAGSFCYALPEDRNQPIEIAADTAEYDQMAGVGTYAGNVNVSQGSMQLTSAQAKIFFKDGEFQRMEATGSPAKFRYKPSAQKDWVNGEGKKVEYIEKEGKVVITGNVKFTQAGDMMTSERMEYDVKKDVMKASASKGNGGQVRMQLQPSSTSRKKK